MIRIRRIFSSLLLATTLVLIGVAAPQASDAKSTAHRVIKQERKADRAAVKSTKRALKKNEVVTQRAAKDYKQAVKRASK